MEQDENFLIVVSNAVVAEDIAETIMERYPGARIMACKTPDEAVSRWSSFTGRTLTGVIVAAHPEDLQNSGLQDRLDGHSARAILLTSREAPPPVPGWQVLPIPFSEDVLVAALDR